MIDSAKSKQEIEGFISFENLKKWIEDKKIQLTSQEIEIMAAIMWSEKNDFQYLNYTNLTKKQEPKYDEQFDFEEEKEGKRLVSHSVPQEPAESKDENVAALNEDQMLEIAQKCFGIIAEKMQNAKITIRGLFEGMIAKQILEGQEQEIIISSDFVNGLQKLGIEEFQELDYACLLKILSINEEENSVRVADLVQILEDYGVHEEIKQGSEPNGEEKQLSIWIIIS